MVEARTRIMNQLQAVALNEGLRCKKRLWRERGRRQLEAFRHMAELIHNEAFVEKIIGFAAKYRAHSTLLRSIRTAGVGKLRWITTRGQKRTQPIGSIYGRWSRP
jgi:hypothetical protein